MLPTPPATMPDSQTSFFDSEPREWDSNLESTSRGEPEDSLVDSEGPTWPRGDDDADQQVVGGLSDSQDDSTSSSSSGSSEPTSTNDVPLAEDDGTAEAIERRWSSMVQSAERRASRLSDVDEDAEETWQAETTDPVPSEGLQLRSRSPPQLTSTAAPPSPTPSQPSSMLYRLGLGSGIAYPLDTPAPVSSRAASKPSKGKGVVHDWILYGEDPIDLDSSVQIFHVEVSNARYRPVKALTLPFIASTLSPVQHGKLTPQRSPFKSIRQRNDDRCQSQNTLYSSSRPHSRTKRPSSSKGASRISLCSTRSSPDVTPSSSSLHFRRRA